MSTNGKDILVVVTVSVKKGYAKFYSTYLDTSSLHTFSLPNNNVLYKIIHFDDILTITAKIYFITDKSRQIPHHIFHSKQPKLYTYTQFSIQKYN